jgi:hypothetical protein
VSGLVEPVAPLGAAVPARLPAVAADSGWRRWLMPSFSDLLFGFVIFWLFLAGEAHWGRLLGDGDTGWHIRVGESILETGVVPTTDPFSFSKPGAPWFAWEWLSEVLLAALHRAGGLKAVTLVFGLLVALYGTLLVRYMVWRGADALAALGTGLLAIGAASIHYLARPHLFTLVLLVLSLWLVERDRRRPSWHVWLLVPGTVLWTNLHGGFPALIVCLGILAGGGAVEAWLAGEPPPRRWRPLVRYGALAALCSAASLINPYGFELHRHMAAYLRSDWIKKVVVEFLAPTFRTEAVRQFEILMMLGLMSGAALVARRRVVEAAWVAVWAHLALTSARHIPIFVIVAAPVVADELTRLYRRWSGAAGPRSVAGILGRVTSDLAPGFRRTSLWPAILVVFLVLSPAGSKWPRDFPAVDFPVAFIDRHQDRIRRGRLFTSDEWADYLLYRFYPRQRVFIDGRSDFYGPQIGDQYIALTRGDADWRGILDRHGFDVVLALPGWPLCSLLRQSRDWALVDQSKEAALFERRR